MLLELKILLTLVIGMVVIFIIFWSWLHEPNMYWKEVKLSIMIYLIWLLLAYILGLLIGFFI